MVMGCTRIYRFLAGDLGHSRSVSPRLRLLFFFSFKCCLNSFSFLVVVNCFSLFSCTLSSGFRAAALDEEYVSTYFWPLLKGGF